MSNQLKKIVSITLMSLLLLAFNACKDLTDLNINHNGAALETANPSAISTNVLTSTAKKFLDIGYWDPFQGVVQYVMKSNFSSDQDFVWSNEGWSGWYSILRNNKKALQQARKLNRPFLEGASLTMQAFVFGLVTNIWGDIPYSEALKGDLDVEGGRSPVFAAQKDVLLGVLDTLKKAEQILSGLDGSNMGSADVYYKGNPKKWAKFANSLRLRYYMRISEKLPDVAKKGIQDVISSGVYFKSNDDDAVLDFLGDNSSTSWPRNTEFDNTQGSDFRRMKPCQTLVNILEERNDPREAIWFEPVEIPIKIDANFSSSPDTVINSVRYIHPGEDVLNSANRFGDLSWDTSSSGYVGIPPNFATDPNWYNLNPDPNQKSHNPHVSYLNFRYKNASGSLLKARLMSYSEVCFILSEFALDNGSIGGKDAKGWYEEGIKASLDTWTVGSDYSDYISQPKVAFDGTLEQIMTQKWISNWTMAVEAWFDYRRTGLPELTPGPVARRHAIPVRFMYPSNEYLLNEENTRAAVNKLQDTNFSGAEGKDSPWSKMWLLEGTGKPW